jgi:hypothetical protein
MGMSSVGQDDWRNSQISRLPFDKGLVAILNSLPWRSRNTAIISQ